MKTWQMILSTLVLAILSGVFKGISGVSLGENIDFTTKYLFELGVFLSWLKTFIISFWFVMYVNNQEVKIVNIQE